jgi:hypothetical protein
MAGNSDESILYEFMSYNIDERPAKRSARLAADRRFEQAYAAVATKGDSAVPENAEAEVDYHYVCFARSEEDGCLYELDGDSKGPVCLGKVGLGEGGDILNPDAIRLIKQYMNQDDGNIGYSLIRHSCTVALADDPMDYGHWTACYGWDTSGPEPRGKHTLLRSLVDPRKASVRLSSSIIPTLNKVSPHWHPIPVSSALCCSWPSALSDSATLERYWGLGPCLNESAIQSHTCQGYLVRTPYDKLTPSAADRKAPKSSLAFLPLTNYGNGGPTQLHR